MKLNKHTKLKVGVVAFDITRYLCGIPKEIAAVWEFNVCDMRRRVHICSYSASAELFRVGYDYVATDEFSSLKDIDPDRWDERNEQLYDWVQGLHTGDDNGVTYVDWNQLTPSRIRGTNKDNILMMKGKELTSICRNFCSTGMKDYIEDAQRKLSPEACDETVWERAYSEAIEEEVSHLRSNSGII